MNHAIDRLIDKTGPEAAGFYRKKITFRRELSSEKIFQIVHKRVSHCAEFQLNNLA